MTVEMIDREKVVKGLEHCTAWAGLHECQPKVGPDCQYEDDADCKLALMRDALALLKEQETLNIYKCKNCGTWVSAENVVRCKDCKHYRKDTCSAGAGMAFPPPDDWFCADGERQ